MKNKHLLCHCFSVFSIVLVVMMLFGYSQPGVCGFNSNKKILNPPPHSLFLNTNFLQTVRQRTIYLGSGFGLRQDWEAPLSGYKGNLSRLGVIRFDYYVSENVAFQVRGAVKQILKFHSDRTSDGKILSDVSDVGDFRIATIANLLPAKGMRPAIGLRVETKLPNTNQKWGLGTNTTDVDLALLATQNFGVVWLAADIGVGILTAPRLFNEQNDVLLYGFIFAWQFSHSFQLAGEISGHYSTRGYVPVGTEDRSHVSLGVVWQLSNFAVEVLPVRGLTGNEGKFGVVGGLSWQLDLF